MHAHTHEQANILALRDATISLHELTERPLATFDALRDAPLKLPCTEEQWPKPCQTVCRLPTQGLDLTATEQAANVVCGAAARRRFLGSGSDLRDYLSVGFDSSCQGSETLPEQCDGAASIALGDTIGRRREGRLFATLHELSRDLVNALSRYFRATRLGETASPRYAFLPS